MEVYLQMQCISSPTYMAMFPSGLSGPVNFLIFTVLLLTSSSVLTRLKRLYKCPNGYIDPSKPAYNETLAKSLGEGFLYKHTSGHCDMNSLRDVFRMLHPKAIIPIHTEKPEAFAQLFNDEWPVVVLNDGDSFSLT